MASPINAGIPSSQWVNSPNKSPYQYCSILVPENRISLYISSVPNCTHLPFLSHLNCHNQGVYNENYS